MTEENIENVARKFLLQLDDEKLRIMSTTGWDGGRFYFHGCGLSQVSAEKIGLRFDPVPRVWVLDGSVNSLNIPAFLQSQTGAHILRGFARRMMLVRAGVFEHLKSAMFKNTKKTDLGDD